MLVFLMQSKPKLQSGDMLVCDNDMEYNYCGMTTEWVNVCQKAVCMLTFYFDQTWPT